MKVLGVDPGRVLCGRMRRELPCETHAAPARTALTSSRPASVEAPFSPHHGRSSSSSRPRPSRSLSRRRRRTPCPRDSQSRSWALSRWPRWSPAPRRSRVRTSNPRSRFPSHLQAGCRGRRVPAHVTGQLVGGLVAAAVVWSLYGSDGWTVGRLGASLPATGVGTLQALGAEAIATCLSVGPPHGDG